MRIRSLPKSFDCFFRIIVPRRGNTTLGHLKRYSKLFSDGERHLRDSPHPRTENGAALLWLHSDKFAALNKVHRVRKDVTNKTLQHANLILNYWHLSRSGRLTMETGIFHFPPSSSPTAEQRGSFCVPCRFGRKIAELNMMEEGWTSKCERRNNCGTGRLVPAMSDMYSFRIRALHRAPASHRVSKEYILV